MMRCIRITCFSGVIVGVLVVVALSVLSMVPGLLFYAKPVPHGQSADLIIVLSGDHGPRLDHAIMLYRKGVASTLLMTGGSYYDTSDSQLMADYALRRGVNQTDYLIESASTSTFENATLSLPIIRQGQFKSVVVVTSGYHSYRSYRVFRSVLPDTIDIYSMPSDPDTQDEFWQWGWWNSPQLMEWYGIEFLKLLVYFFYYL